MYVSCQIVMMIMMIMMMANEVRRNKVLTNVPKRVKRASGVTFYSRQRQCLAQGSRQEYK